MIRQQAPLRPVLLTALLTLGLCVADAPRVEGQRKVGELTLPLPSGVDTVVIEDVSPDRGSQPETDPPRRPHYASQWGVMLSVVASGRQLASSPATGWTAPNGPVIVDHVGSVDADRHLLAFYWSPETHARSGRTKTAGWKAVDVTEKTRVEVAVEQPTSWQVEAGGVLTERLAARDAAGTIYAFSWRPGSDWTAQRVHPVGSPNVASTVTGWTSPSGSQTEEHLAARTRGNDLVHFGRVGGSAWTQINVSTATGRQIAGDPQGWRPSQGSAVHVAAQDASQNLLLFTRTSGGTWSVVDVSGRTNGQRVTGRASAWNRAGRQYIATRSPQRDLLVFSQDPIESTWSVENVSAATGGVRIQASPTSWLTTSGSSVTTHIVAPDLGGRIRVFSRTNGGSWSVADVTAVTNVTTTRPLAAWTTPWSGSVIQHLAAPTQDARLHVFSLQAGQSWSAVDVTTRASGRVVYSGSPYGGVWTSRDYGLNWAQSTRPMPHVGATSVPQSLPVPTILDVAVSPVNRDLVIAAADREDRGTNQARVSSGAGIYRSTDGGKSWSNVYTFRCGGRNESVSQVLFAPNESRRVYAAGGCGIARSTDAGANWTLISPPQTPAGNPVGNRRVWHLAVSRQLSRDTLDRTIVACGDGAMWISRRDGAAASWALDVPVAGLPPGFCRKTGYETTDHTSARALALDPRRPTTVYYAHPNRSNGPSFYHPAPGGPQGVPCNMTVVYDVDGDRVLDPTDMAVRATQPVPAAGSALRPDADIRFVDGNGSGTWTAGESTYYDADNDGRVSTGDSRLAGNNQAAGTALEADTLLRYVRVRYGTFESDFGPRPCGEGSLWLGDLSSMTPASPDGAWSQLPGPPVFWGNTGSGAVEVTAHPTDSGHLVVFADQDTWHVSVGRPTAGGWYRLDGLNPSEARSMGISDERLSVHVDPHGFAATPDFDLRLRASTQSPPYNLNAALDRCEGGRIWVSSDGGIYSNTDCGEVDEEERAKRWQPTESGLNTLFALNIVGATGARAVSVVDRGLYFGSTHDDDFYSLDDGRTWKSPSWTCGDCDTWWGDLYQSRRILKLDPRFNRFGSLHNPAGEPPDARSSHLTAVPYPDSVSNYVGSGRTIAGYRPVIQSLPTETPPARGDYLAIADSNGRRLLRARDALDATTAQSGFQRVGDTIPRTATWVQAAGGHADPTYFLGDGTRIWRSGVTGGAVTWTQVAPDDSVTVARRFFVNPWNEDVVYVIADSAVYVSLNGGDLWRTDANLSAAVTAGGDWPYVCSGDFCPLADMAFDPTNPSRRFAAGLAGVFYTANGVNWYRLLDTRAIPSRPLGLWFDPLTDRADASLYVANLGRGILRIHPIPNENPRFREVVVQPPPDLFTWRISDDLLRDVRWELAGQASQTREADETEAVTLVLGGAPDGNGLAARWLEVPCEEVPYRLAYRWIGRSGAGNESSSLLTVSLLSDETRIPVHEWDTAFGVADDWSRATVDLVEFGCGEVRLEFEAVLGGHGATTFTIDEVVLERAEPGEG